MAYNNRKEHKEVNNSYRNNRFVKIFLVDAIFYSMIE